MSTTARPEEGEPITAAADPGALARLGDQIRQWGHEAGFSALGIADIDLAEAEEGLLNWLARGFHGEMDYMARHARLRARPAELVPGTVRVIVVRCDYLPAQSDAQADDWIDAGWSRMGEASEAYVAHYAHGRDYHKVLRQRLQALATRIAAAIGPFGYRVFTDSAPVLEVELARKAGLGWRGKHTLLLSREAGSTFFIGEIFVDVPLPVSEPVEEHCGSCSRCIDVCPTRAIVAPYLLDARRCIAYLTIELKGSIPTELRPLIGNRIYGCDDCQLACPWNKFAQRSQISDFDQREYAHATLIEAFSWSEAHFLEQTAGSALRRIGHEQWLRNVAVALGNALRTAPDASHQALRLALMARADDASALVREHVCWALAQEDGAALSA